MPIDNPSLLAAVLADPAADGPRLVLADWLEENGQPERAEFIRCQVSVAHTQRGRSPKPSWRLRLNELLRREFALWEEYAEWWFLTPNRWLGSVALELEGAQKVPVPCAIVRRGWVAEVRCTLADWLAHGPALVRAQPLERVELTDVDPAFGADQDAPLYRFHAEDEMTAGVGGTNFLPRRLWALLRGHEKMFLPDSKYYPAEAAARAALSAACLAWARAAGPAGDGGR